MDFDIRDVDNNRLGQFLPFNEMYRIYFGINCKLKNNLCAAAQRLKFGIFLLKIRFWPAHILYKSC